MSTSKRPPQIRTTEWWKPERVSVGADDIFWQLGQADTVHSSPASCLFEFIGLAENSNAQSLSGFTETYGVLNLGSNGLPRPAPDIRTLTGDDTFVESVQAWQAYAQNAVLLLATANAIQDGVPTLDQRLLPVPDKYREAPNTPDAYVLGLLSERWTEPASTEELRTELSERLQSLWIDPSNIAPVFEWRGKTPSLEIRASAPQLLIAGDELPAVYWNLPSAFDIIATELTHAILTNQRLTRCNRCDSLMLALIKPRSDRPIYCPNCRVLIHRDINRESQRRRLQRQREDPTD